MSDDFESGPTHQSTPEPSAESSAEPPSPEVGDLIGPRQKSTIRFPYNDLGDVEGLAILMHERRGREADIATLAADADTENTSSFRSKINAGVIFGLFETIRGEGALRLTSLGERMADPDVRETARVEAFLHVPLYRKVFDHYHGSRMPGDQGLEAELQRMGVAPKQAPRARQAMARSAEVAGFYGAGRDRLVEPSPRRVGGGTNGGANAEETRAPEEGQGRRSGPTISVMEHPLILGLLQVLPDPGQPLSATRRQEWISTLTANMKFIWPEPEESSPTAQRQPREQSQSVVLE